MNEGQKSILIVEDEAMLRNVLRSRFADRYIVLEAQDGQEAFELCEKHKPTLVLLDLLLPKMDGFQFLQKLRNTSSMELSLIPVVVFSNLNDEENIKKAETLQVTKYYPKSQTKLDTLCKQVEKTLEYI